MAHTIKTNKKLHSAPMSLEVAKQQFETIVNHYSQHKENMEPFVNKEYAMKEYVSIHKKLMDVRYTYLNVGCKERMLDFWFNILINHKAQFENVLKIVESILVCQLNICICERTFGLRKLILNPRRSSMDSKQVERIVRIKLNSIDCIDFIGCQRFYQECVHYFKQS